jgi:hypothetical protein
MKKNIVKWIVTGALAFAVTISFAQGLKKVADANSDSVVTEDDVHQARVDSTSDYRRFKAAAELKISENEKSIGLLRAKRSAFTQEAKERYDKSIVMLREKNVALKNRIDVSGQTATDQWWSFKKEFNHDLQELGRDIKTVASDHTL